jgi:hypothetical protein
MFLQIRLRLHDAKSNSGTKNAKINKCSQKIEYFALGK